jgi:SulP family sulfate permease
MPTKPIFSPRFLDVLRRKTVPYTLKEEITAGITVGLIALPLALALGIASIPAGAETPMPAPALGIFTAIIAGLIISGLGGSRVQIGGPTAAFIPIILVVISDHGYSGLILATLMAGGILVLMGVTRMGILIKFIPWPVTSGFTTGIAVAIMLTQIPDFFGLRLEEAVPKEFAERVPFLFRNLGSFNPFALGFSLVCVGVILFWPRLRLRMIPGSIVAMLGATVLLVLLGWEHTREVATIGSKFGASAIPSGFPRPSLPAWDMELIRALIGPATAIALLCAIESLLSAVVADGLSGDRHDSNTELIAQGIANMVCPFFGGLPITGAIARTSANVHNGGKTPLAGIFHALTLVAIVLLAARWAAFIPMATISAVLIVISLKMGEWHELMRLHKMPRSDALVLFTTFALTVIFDLVIAVQVGMVLAAVLFIKRVAETTEITRVDGRDTLEKPEQLAQGKDIPEGVVVYRIFGPFLFGAAEKMEDAVSTLDELPRVLIFRLNLVTAMDATGMNALISIVERMQQHHRTVLLSGLHQQPLRMMQKSGFVTVIGEKNICATFDDALHRATYLVDKPSTV